MRKLIIFPPVLSTQTCLNCKTPVGADRLPPNLVEMREDAGGMPSFIVRCPVCKTLMEWETRSN
jgi:hypothetical protein